MQEKKFYVSLQNYLCLALLRECSIEEFRVILGLISKCNSLVKALHRDKNIDYSFFNYLEEMNEYNFADEYGEGIGLRDIRSLIRKQTNSDFKTLLNTISKIELNYIRVSKKYNENENINFKIFDDLYLNDDGALDIKFTDEALNYIFNIENEYRIDNIDLLNIKKCNSKYKIYMYLYYLKHKNINKSSLLTMNELRKTFDLENLENKALSRNIEKSLDFLNNKLDIKNSNEKVKSKKDNKTLIGLQINFI